MAKENLTVTVRCVDADDRLLWERECRVKRGKEATPFYQVIDLSECPAVHQDERLIFDPMYIKKLNTLEGD